MFGTNKDNLTIGLLGVGVYFIYRASIAKSDGALSGHVAAQTANIGNSNTTETLEVGDAILVGDDYPLRKDSPYPSESSRRDAAF